MNSLFAHFTGRRGVGRFGAVCLGVLALGACNTTPPVVHYDAEGVPNRSVQPGFANLGHEPIDGPGVAAIVWQDGDQFVRVDSLDPKAAANSSPPLILSPNEVRRALEAVLLVKSGGDPAPALDNRELDALSGPVAKALATLKPGQDVSFLVHHSGGLSSLVQKVTTGGRIFPDNGSLDVIFGRVRAPEVGETIVGGESPTRKTGSRGERTQTDYAVVVEGPVSLADPARPDWAKVGPAAWGRAAATPASQSPSQPASAAVGTAAVPMLETAPARNTHDPDDIAKRLEVLNGMRQKHLITEEEYARKKADLLSRL
ncbi:MAG TPA: SHOCT domain-containing protein [Telmatospirillum sp.]|nr:SHOCT domain-containing protein [Telmatospirillum sp.]